MSVHLNEVVAHARVLADGLAFPEGGPAMDPQGRAVFVQIFAGVVSRLEGPNRVETIAIAQGGPNSVVAARGHFGGSQWLLTQNGGVAGSWRSGNPVDPGIQCIVGDAVGYLSRRVAGAALVAPNDLVVTADGTLFFTDPREGYDPSHAAEHGRIYWLDAQGGEGSLDVGPTFPNGIAFDPEHGVVWTESYSRRVCRWKDGEREVLTELPDGHIPDGLAIRNGIIVVTTTASGGLVAIDRHGGLTYAHVADDAYTTNCEFTPLGELLVTDAVSVNPESPDGRLWNVTVPWDAIPM